ncbi:YqaE/Pmp3 family membrane protein [Enterobacter kobei]|uniref:YqaE/Pmp3 family membrane protein n=1 Tax=Enterobacter kobei TaxID=208224 RepID=UPI003CF7F0D9
MRLILAIFLPFISFFTIGKPFQGLLCLILQVTIIGWIPAAIWAVYALSGWKTDQKIKKAQENAQLNS